MALIICPHCGNPISDKAEKCIHCGVTFNKENTHSNPQDSEPAVVDEPKPKVKSDNSGKFFVTFYVAIIIIVVVAFLGLIAYVYYHFSTKDEVADSSNVEQFNNATCEHSDSLAVDTVYTVKDDVINERMADEAKSIRTMDLSAFMLHGKVKSVEESYGGQVSCTYYFSEQGELTKAAMSEGDYRCKIKRQTNNLILSFENPNDEYGGWGYVYTIDNSGRLISYIYGSQDGGDETTYSNFNSNDWPTRSKTVAELGGAVTISTMNYSQIDENGNWTLQTSKDNEGKEVITYRSIEYYK